MNNVRNLEQAVPIEGLPLILKALHFAADKHRHQRRKDAGASPYINHPIAVAEILCSVGAVRDPLTIAASILHDTIEDTETTAAELEAQFGTEIRRIVEEVSDDKSLSSEVRKRLQIEHAHKLSLPARLVKFADKICNVRDVIDCPPADWSTQRRRDYVAWAQAVINQLRGTNVTLECHFDELCLRALAQIDNQPSAPVS